MFDMSCFRQTVDHTSLYRQFSRQNGVDTGKAPQYNVDDWLNPESPSYNPTLTNAIFYYQAQTEAGECFKVCISTKDMFTAAWRYAHHSQLVLDGTFGVCSSRLLLFIALAQDNDGKGLTIAFFCSLHQLATGRHMQAITQKS